ncbi:D-alanine--D-alanine ligase [soil metagenome]
MNINWLQQLKLQPWYIKLTHWEYWSFNTVYIPICWYFFLLAIRAGNISFFNAANPSIKYGGFLMESKWDIYHLLPKAYTPITNIIYKKENSASVCKKATAFNFPIICKPDVGSRGRGVAVIHNIAELLSYHEQVPANYLLQEKINYPLEAGIFYVRMPGKKDGIITGIVEKEFLTITGNGHDTIKALIMQNERYVLQLHALQQMLGNTMQHVPLAGEKQLLVPFGNHARGCRFIDSTYRVNEKLTQVINDVCKSVDQFYFGRLDIRFKSWEALENGEHFSIIELNGSGSEPTHIYDPSRSIFSAWKEIIKHWILLYRISSSNHANGIPYLTFKETKKMFADNKAFDKLMNNFQFDPSEER